MRKILESTMLVAALAVGGWVLAGDSGYQRVGSAEADGVRGAACYTSGGWTIWCFWSCGYMTGDAIGTAPGPVDLVNTACSAKAGCTLATVSVGPCIGT